MKSIIFVTGNAEKVRDVQHACKDYDITFTQQKLDIDEIQHHDPLKIAEHKAKAAYSQVGEPVVVNDSFWSIPALGGFPGGYMKDMNEWLTTEDFLALMRDKTDRSIILTDVNGYYDGEIYQSFVTTRYGKFIEEPRGESGPSFSKILVMENDEMTVSEIFDQPTRTIDSERYEQWHDFARWYLSKD